MLEVWGNGYFLWVKGLGDRCEEIGGKRQRMDRKKSKIQDMNCETGVGEKSY